MSVDEHSVISHNKQQHYYNHDSDEDKPLVEKVKVKTRDLHNKDNYLFFELFSLYTKQYMSKNQTLKTDLRDQDDHPPMPKKYLQIYDDN